MRFLAKLFSRRPYKEILKENHELAKLLEDCIVLLTTTKEEVKELRKIIDDLNKESQDREKSDYVDIFQVMHLADIMKELYDIDGVKKLNSSHYNEQYNRYGFKEILEQRRGHHEDIPTLAYCLTVEEYLVLINGIKGQIADKNNQ
jgi:hypothetical protein